METRTIFDAIVTYGEVDEEMCAPHALQDCADFMYLIDEKENFTVKTLKHIKIPESKFLEILDEDMFFDLNLDKVKGIILTFSSDSSIGLNENENNENDDDNENYDERECIIMIDDKTCESDVFCLVDDDLLRKRLDSFQFYEKNYTRNEEQVDFLGTKTRDYSLLVSIFAISIFSCIVKIFFF